MAPRGEGTVARNATIEGRPVLVVERTPPLPRSLELLLGSMLVTYRDDVRPRGATVACEQLREHDFRTLAKGRHVGLDGLVRDLHVRMCRDCGAAQVRDISVDAMPGLPVGRGGARRRDVILGWYTGRRRNARQYT
jgi:hypothetical protein